MMGLPTTSLAGGSVVPRSVAPRAVLPGAAEVSGPLVGHFMNVSVSIVIDGVTLTNGSPWPRGEITAIELIEGTCHVFDPVTAGSFTLNGDATITGADFLVVDQVILYPSGSAGVNVVLPQLDPGVTYVELVPGSGNAATMDLSAPWPDALTFAGFNGADAVTLPASIPAGLTTLFLLSVGLTESQIDDLLTLLSGFVNFTLDISGHVITAGQQTILEDHIANDGWTVTADWNP